MKKLEGLMRSGRKALIPYFTTCYPGAAESLETFKALAAAGADCLEIGIPFSDPLADGATIQASSHRAIEAGGSLRQGLGAAGQLRSAGVEIPLIVFTYYNPVYRMGLMNFARKAAEAGADGVLVPDLPVEESGLLREALAAFDMGMVFLAAPTSTAQRLRYAQEHSTGFVYAVSVAGVTGARKSIAERLPAFIERVRQAGDLPVGVGFGVSDPEQAVEVAGCADGVIIGSAFIDAYEKGGPEAVGRLAGEIRTALDGAF
ncbi:MAG: tryptophan synthase subunit alpha [Planctomycetes bacterium]|nr:tryptophan synthase subunit alpha [Planctomycetota bacterium]